MVNCCMEPLICLSENLRQMRGSALFFIRERQIIVFNEFFEIRDIPLRL